MLELLTAGPLMCSGVWALRPVKSKAEGLIATGHFTIQLPCYIATLLYNGVVHLLFILGNLCQWGTPRGKVFNVIANILGS